MLPGTDVWTPSPDGAVSSKRMRAARTTGWRVGAERVSLKEGSMRTESSRPAWVTTDAAGGGVAINKDRSSASSAGQSCRAVGCSCSSSLHDHIVSVSWRAIGVSTNSLRFPCYVHRLPSLYGVSFTNTGVNTNSKPRSHFDIFEPRFYARPASKILLFRIPW